MKAMMAPSTGARTYRCLQCQVQSTETKCWVCGRSKYLALYAAFYGSATPDTLTEAFLHPPNP